MSGSAVKMGSMIDRMKRQEQELRFGTIQSGLSTSRMDRMNPSSCHNLDRKGRTLAEKSSYCFSWLARETNRLKEFLIMSALRNLILVTALAVGIVPGAYAFDGTPTPNKSIGPSDISPTEALRTGARQYYSGDKTGALSSLQYAAENGQPMAAWKLGKMYATGDGVQEDDMKAFQYYTQVVREHGDDRPDAPDAPFVASAFVALGSYYLNGITEGVPRNVSRAKQIFTHAASYFGDPDAQYELGRIYQSSSNRLAVRWYNLAAIKGHIGAQARLGETLYTMAQSDSRKARGLMWMSVARMQADGEPAVAWIGDLHEQYFAHASETVRRLASSMTDTWVSANRPDLMQATTAAQQTTQ